MSSVPIVNPVSQPREGVKPAVTPNPVNTAVPTIGAVAERAMVPYADPEAAMRAIRDLNTFPNVEERERTIKMAYLAALMYQDIDSLSEGDYVREFVPLPTPEAVGVTLPAGLKIQAFRRRGEEEVIFAIRGTELNKDKTTLFKNLIADAGIGRHKTNEELIASVKLVIEQVSSLYQFEMDEKMVQMFVDLINVRVTGHSDSDRNTTIAIRVGSAMGKGGAIGGAGGTVIGILGGVTLVVVGIASGPLAIGIGIAAAASAAAFGAGVSGTVETAKCVTAADGYPTFQSYVRGCDAYVMKLKEKNHIAASDKVVFTGHSLGGHLVGVLGYAHGDEVYAFNGPGVDFKVEAPAIFKNLGLNREARLDKKNYHSYSQRSDFIGNLGNRSGRLQHLHVPIPLHEEHRGFPACLYTSPLSHHGIDLIFQVLNNSSISTPSLDLPYSYPAEIRRRYFADYRLAQLRALEEQAPRLESPTVEEVNDEGEPVEAPRLSAIPTTTSSIVPKSTPNFLVKLYNFAIGYLPVVKK